MSCGNTIHLRCNSNARGRTSSPCCFCPLGIPNKLGVAGGGRLVKFRVNRKERQRLARTRTLSSVAMINRPCVKRGRKRAEETGTGTSARPGLLFCACIERQARLSKSQAGIAMFAHVRCASKMRSFPDLACVSSSDRQVGTTGRRSDLNC